MRRRSLERFLAGAVRLDEQGQVAVASQLTEAIHLRES
jgi:hypothetical protein